MKRTLPLKGIHCASCVSNVEKILSGVKGIDEFSVNLALKSLTIGFKSEKDLDIAKSKLNNGGYELVTEDNSNPENHYIEEISEWKRRLIISSLFGIPLFIIAMGEMIGLSIPISGIQSNIIQLILKLI